MKNNTNSNKEISIACGNLWMLLICLSGVFELLLSGCGSTQQDVRKNGAGHPREIPAVRVAEVTRESVPIQLFSVGNVDPYAKVEVKAQVSGEIVAVHFTEGDFVKKGQELFSIDARPYEVALRQAEAALARARAQSEQALATLDRDRAQAVNTQREHERNESLFTKKMISQEEYDQSKTQVQAGNAVVSAEEAAVKAADKMVQSAQADIDEAQLFLSYCKVCSPIDGRTGSLLINAGNIVRANDTNPLVVITQIQPIYVTFTVPEKHLAGIRSYMAQGPLSTSVIISGEENAAISGTLSFVDNSVDTSTGTIRLKSTFENTDQRLWPGQFVSVKLNLVVSENAIVAPFEAVQMGQSGYYSYVVKSDNTVELRNIIPGETWQQQTIIKEGLQPGDMVIIDGILRAAPGVTVQIMTDSSTAQSNVTPDTPAAEKD